MQIEEIEAALGRLMPPALSGECQSGIEAMIDELAGPEEEIVEMPVRGRSRGMIAGGIAAAFAGLLAVFSISRPAALPVVAAVTKDAAGLVLVGESDRVESMTDEGLKDADGSAMRAVRLSVVAENRLRDEETGIVMQVSEPREELLLTPVSAF